MSGICAVIRKAETGKVPTNLGALCSGISLHQSSRARTETESNAGVGAMVRFPTQQVYRSPRVLIASDADLYNEADIRRLSESSNDAGVAAQLAALYERFGIEFLDKLRGDFSLILWDIEQRLLFAATDCFGVHPLVYFEDEKVFLIASRIEALVATGEVPRDVNPAAIANYLNYTVNLAPKTILTRVDRLLPGHFLVASHGRVRTQKYWDMRYAAEERADEEDLARRLEVTVEAAIRAQSKADSFSKVGAYLSGGTDSSTVTGMMSRLNRGPVKTFSIGFEEQRFNELEYARMTATKFKTDHHEYLVNADDCAEALPDMIRHFDEPFGNSSAIPTYFCARLAAQNGVDVLLAGDGGDELFGGNERYLTNHIFAAYQKIPRLARKGLIEPALTAIPIRNRFVGLARSYVRRSNLPQPDRFFSYNLILDNPLAAVFEPEFVERLGSFSVLEMPQQYYWKGPATEELDRLLYVDVKITLGDNDLLKVTRMSELAGIRSRFPLLAREVAEFSGLIPAGLKVKGTEKRYLFKRAFRNLLPMEVIKKKKHGFGIPVAVWMKSNKRMRELMRDTLLSSKTYQRGYIRRSFVEGLIRKHETDETAFYGDTLWTFLALELWFQQFVDEPRKAAA